jgi:K+-transporting ATPase ATPase B chain
MTAKAQTPARGLSTTWRPALRESFIKLDPRHLLRNPVMFVVEVGTVLTLLATLGALVAGAPIAYELAVFLILFVTLLFANFAEAIAEARGKAQASSLRAARSDTLARRLVGGPDGEEVRVSSLELVRGDLVRVSAGEVVPADGEIIAGIASIDESAITGESAPVLREAGTDKSGVTGGTRVLSDTILVQVAANRGDNFLDRMIALVEGANRQRTPNELALSVLLAALTLVFLIVVATLPAIAGSLGVELSIPTLVALLVCLIPTTIGGLLPAIGIAGMDRALRKNLIAKSGKAVEVAGDIDVLLLDKTGTITFGNRQATSLLPVRGVSESRLRDAAALSSVADVTPEGKSIVALAKLQGAPATAPGGATFIEFSAQTRMSGVDLADGRRLRKGASDRITQWVRESSGSVPADLGPLVDSVASRGATPLVVAEGPNILGVVALTDVVKPGIRERFARFRQMGIKTIMVTGDNPLTAAAIAAEAGVDDYMAEARPEDKLERIRHEQREGRLVAMMGDGTNDAPALAQADIGVAMNSGTQAAREAGNMIDLDSDPTKLLEVVEIGKQLLITRGALTTFSIANDIAKYFAIIPALFVLAFPAMAALDIMGLGSPESAILSALIFNAVIIPALIPLALRGVTWKPSSGDALLLRNLLLYGGGGVIAPFVGIKLIDLLLAGLGLA